MGSGLEFVTPFKSRHDIVTSLFALSTIFSLVKSIDIITHALVAFSSAKLLKRSDDEVYACLIGAICLDFDILIAFIPLLLPQLYVFTHRGVTHSIFISPLVSAIALYIFTSSWVTARVNKFISINAKFNLRILLAAYLGALSHILLDYSTTSGVPVFYPFSIDKYAAELFHYMDFGIMIFGIGLILLLYKYRYKYKDRGREKIKNPRLFLAAFLLLILATGGFRSLEKNSAASTALFPANVYPTSNPFVWWILEEDDFNNSIYARRYDTLLKTEDLLLSYPKLEIIAGNSSNFKEAYALAKALPQVERFYWNSAKISITAIYFSSSESWLIQLRDPLRDAIQRSSPSFYLAGRSSLNVSISKLGAEVFNKG
ncbi:MAG: metal-dependent hydrolase [Methanocellales archaeon]